MKVYLVIDRDEESADIVFGVFSSREKAEKIMNDLLKNFDEFGDSEDHNICIIELELDKTSDNYHWCMNNY